MKLKTIVSFVMLVGVCGWSTGRLVAEPPTAKPQPVTAQVGTVPEIAGYTKWKVVNEKAFRLPGYIATLCSAPSTAATSVKTPAQIGESEEHIELTDRFIRVFVNKKGKAAMFAMTPHFPVGSVVVKEKLPDEKSRKPELLTVMIKREAGYDAKNGDWEYLVADGNGRKAYSRGKLAHCQSCHVEQRQTDYIFRRYLPDGALH